jgi:chlorite dismutase
MALDIQIPEKEGLNLAEKGRKDGQVIQLNRRLFMQFMAFGNASETSIYIEALEQVGLSGVLYEDLNDPQGIGLLFFSEQPADFIEQYRKLLNSKPFDELTLKPEFTMLGRTYSIGYEPDLEQVLINRPIQRVTDPKNNWVVWYPLRRAGSFQQLSASEQRTILMEHGGIGRAYGEAGLANDIRLASFGLDKNDNDFVIGLLGRELHPLSAIVERMRKTVQTSQYLTNLGPFFVGKVAWQKSNTE